MKEIKLSHKQLTSLIENMVLDYTTINTNRLVSSHTVGEIRESKNFIEKSEKSGEDKNTKGKFGSWCKSQKLDDGGEITIRCINKAMKSDDSSVVKMANFAKNIKGYKGYKD